MGSSVLSDPAVRAGRSVDVAGTPVRVHELGAGPPVLLLHGSGPGTTGWGAWAPVAAALAERHRVVVPDQAGFGATPVPHGGRPGLAGWSAQAAGLMEALELERFAVVGHSMGGAVALALAAERPDAVTRVAGVGSMGAAMPLTPALDRLWGARPGQARMLLELLFDDPALVTDAAVLAREESLAAGAGAFAALFPPPRDRWVLDLTPPPGALAAVAAPVLLVHGARDRVVPLRDAALPLLESLPDARLHAFGRCGHVPAVEHPAAFVRLLSDFLEPDA
jgi:pimeloyl-ACP methyl ester carboxylesterase